ncbi:hypothetical protein C8J56DRAFT_1669 [Mycena floridula]|nr:hypothetical protein C8J56DRAFT_1669 [Mycena floridula]
MSWPQLPLICHQCGNNYIEQIPVLPNIHDFAHLSRTNDAPMVEELSSIEADISIREKEIHALREAVEKLQSALDILKPRLEAATDALCQQKSILHPIRRVPAEILQLLFSACMTVWQSEPTSIRRYHTGPLASFPWNLSYVCQRWRRTSIESPDLWSTIEVLGGGSHDRPVERALQFMLDRSASSPLYITLDFPDIAVQHDLIAIVGRIIPHSARWSSLD